MSLDAMDLRLDDLRHPAVIALLQEHLDWMHRISPPESVHALDLDGLRRPTSASGRSGTAKRWRAAVRCANWRKGRAK